MFSIQHDVKKDAIGVTTFPETPVLIRCTSENTSTNIAWPQNFVDSKTFGRGKLHFTLMKDDGSVEIQSHLQLHQCLNLLTWPLQSVVS